MERKFKLITSGSEEYSQVTNIITIVDDSITVLEAVKGKLSEVLNADIFSVFDMNGVLLFTEEAFEDDDSEPFICRWCGILIESEHGMFVEDYDVCHCEECHDKLYTKEAWDALYNEYNEVDENKPTNFNSDCYYWTTAP